MGDDQKGDRIKQGCWLAIKRFTCRNWIPLVLALVIGSAFLFVVGFWLNTPNFVKERASAFETASAAAGKDGEASAPDESLLARTGQYGDMFGAVNALFTGLAFAGTVIAILLQTLELRQQREEMRKSNAQFKKQNKILEDQAAAAKADRKAAEERRQKENWPTFVFRRPVWTAESMAVQVTNYGNAALEVAVQVFHTGIKAIPEAEDDWQPVPHDLAVKPLEFRRGSSAFGPGTRFHFRINFVTNSGELAYRTYLAEWGERIRENRAGEPVVVEAVGRG